MIRRFEPLLSLAFATAVLLFILQCLLGLTLMVDAYLAFGWAEPKAMAWGLVTLLGFIVNAYFLRFALRLRHFLGLYAFWRPFRASDLDQALSNLAVAAQDAFLEGDWERCLRLLDRLQLQKDLPAAHLNKGACLVHMARMSEAAASFRQSGNGRSAALWLEGRRALALFSLPPYFTAKDARRLDRSSGWLAFCLVVLTASATVVGLHVRTGLAYRQRMDSGFDAQGFLEARRGELQIYYHDAVFMEKIAELAAPALQSNLRFFGLPPGTFESRPVRLYLCADKEEYLTRSPFTREWEAAQAIPALNSIYLYPSGQDATLDGLLAHEISHLCYHQIIPGIRKDSWLNEGLADYVGYTHALGRLGFATDAWLKANHFKSLAQESLPFEAFLEDSPRSMTDTAQIQTFYRQGFSIVYVLITYFGKERFITFLRDYSKSRSVEGSLARNYSSLPDLAALKATWGLFMKP